MTGSTIENIKQHNHNQKQHIDDSFFCMSIHGKTSFCDSQKTSSPSIMRFVQKHASLPPDVCM